MYRAYLARRHRHEGPHRSWTSSPFSASPEGSLMYRAYLARRHRHEGSPPQLDFVVFLSQPGRLPHVSGLPREEACGR